MSETVGGVKATFSGDSSGLTKSVADVITKFDGAKQKAAELNAVLKDVSKTSQMSADGLNMLKQQAADADREVKKLAGSQSGASGAMQTLGKSMGNAKASMGAAMGAMSALSGEGGKIATVALGAGTAINSMSEQFKSSGVGAAAAAGAIGLVALSIQLLNKYIEEQDKKAQKLEDIWSNLTKKATELRQAADEAMTSAMSKAELNIQLSNPNLNKHEVEVLKAKAVAMQEQKKIANEMASTALAIADAQNKVSRATADTREEAERTLLALQAAQSSNVVAFKTQNDMVEKADMFETAQEEAERAAERRSAAEQRAKAALEAQLQILIAMREFMSTTGLGGDGAAAWRMGGLAQAGAGVAMAQDYLKNGNTPSDAWGTIDLRRDPQTQEDFREWMSAQIGATRLDVPQLTSPVNQGAYQHFDSTRAGGLLPELKSMVPANELRMVDENSRLKSVVTEMPDAIAKAAPVFGEGAAMSLISGLTSGNLGTMITSMGTALGVATGVPIVGQILGAVVGIAQQIGEVFMKAGEHIGEMMLRPINAVMSKGGASKVAGAVGQYASDMGKAAQTQMSSVGAQVIGGPIFGAIAAAAMRMFGQIQQGIASIGFLFTLTTMNEKFEKFSVLIGSAFQTMLDPLGDIWVAMMPVAGAFLLISEAMAPVVKVMVSILPLTAVMNLLFGAVKGAAIAVVSLAKVFVAVSWAFSSIMHAMKMISDEEFERRRKATGETYKALEEAGAEIAAMTQETAENAANREERKAAREAAIEEAKAKHRQKTEAREAAIQAAKEKALGGAANAINEFGSSLTNVPSGYKRRLNELMFGAADAEDPTSSGSSAAPIGTISAITVNIGTWYSRSSMSEDLNNIKRFAKNGTLAAQAAARTFNPDDRN